MSKVTLADLKIIARSKGIIGFSRMNKATLEQKLAECDHLHPRPRSPRRNPTWQSFVNPDDVSVIAEERTRIKAYNKVHKPCRGYLFVPMFYHERHIWLMADPEDLPKYFQDLK
jgi:hypothetical protein